ncbi:MAG: ribosome assembly cofactor RimP [Prolixibacteraceae bacterium]|nr:ribosome assembly cofactor RimP [Prolixibacteraceae bacterium]
MAEKEKIVELVKGQLTENMFLVDVIVNPSNSIQALVDSLNGVTIDECVKISRYLEQQLDRDKEDFSLEVSSPGLTEPFKVREQYLKNTGRNVKILTITGDEMNGELKEATDDFVVIVQKKKEKVEGYKKKQLIIKENKLKYEDIRSAKIIVTFK